MFLRKLVVWAGSGAPRLVRLTSRFAQSSKVVSSVRGRSMVMGWKVVAPGERFSTAGALPARKGVTSVVRRMGPILETPETYLPSHFTRKSRPSYEPSCGTERLLWCCVWCPGMNGVYRGILSAAKRDPILSDTGRFSEARSFGVSGTGSRGLDAAFIVGRINRALAPEVNPLAR